MTPSENLTKLERRLGGIYRRQNDDLLSVPFERLTDACNDIGKSWSGSFIGYQSRVYYTNLEPTPPGCCWSVEWGAQEVFGSGGTVGNWSEYTFEAIADEIYNRAEVESLDELQDMASRAKAGFEEIRALAKSTLSKVEKANAGNSFFDEWTSKIDEIHLLSAHDCGKQMMAGRQAFSRDIIAMQGGFLLPPHLDVLSKLIAVKIPFNACESLAKILHALAAHLEEYDPMKTTNETEGSKVFIGHGSSSAWKDLRDFIEKRLKLPWDEFNRIPVAGISNAARLNQMRAEAKFAFVILTAEDEQRDKLLHPRLNVVHEVGLFQGSLGFERAIVLLEEGCEEFSNIEGLGQIRFPKGKISTSFEEIRLVLEREGLLLPP